MTDSRLRRTLLQSVIAVLGTAAAFAFLSAGAFRALDADTWARMTSPEGLRAAALGAAYTALLVAPLIAWEYRRSRRRHDGASSGTAGR